ncbi:MAG: hypothetical protein PHY59_03415 [Methanobacterium sp.]|nr:hypothetical protein [Methanobacterium sp.]
MNISSTYDFKDAWTRYLIFSPIPVLLILICILAILRLNMVWHPFTIFSSLNITSLTIPMFFIAILCVINYWIKPTATIMLLGFGALTLGFGSLLTGFSIMGNGINPNIHIYNISACISGFFILLSTLLNNRGKLKYLGSK